MASALERIARLKRLSLPALRLEWRRIFGDISPPVDLTSEMLVRALAWRFQEKTFGGLSPTRVRELDALAKQIEKYGKFDLRRHEQLRCGNKLVREWRGTQYVVEVLASGFQYDNRYYPALTPIARAITGSPRSGPRFFGLAPPSLPPTNDE